MSIQINNNFDYKGNQPNFERDQFETLELMRSADERSLDEGHISYCIETGKHYVFNENNAIDVETGKWRLLTDNAGSVDFTKYVNKTTDLASGFTGSEIDKTKVTTIKELDDLLTLVNTSLSKKVNTSDIIDDCLHTDIDKPVSARVAKELKNKIEDITISVSGSGSVVLKKLFENVTANTVNKFDSPLPLDNACMINVYKLQSGNTNLNDSLKALENNTKQDFIKNDDEIVIDDKGAKIKDSYEYNSILNSNGFYESKIINKNNYLEILGIEVIY